MSGGERYVSKSNSSRNKLVVPGAKNAIDQMKYEIANEFGVNLGPDTTARDRFSRWRNHKTISRYGSSTNELIKQIQSI